MIRIWAYTLKDGKMSKSFIYESIDNWNPDTFRNHVENLCHELDIPTPIILKSHINNYVDFNNTTFLTRDFVEYVDFDKLILENAIVSK